MEDESIILREQIQEQIKQKEANIKAKNEAVETNVRIAKEAKNLEEEIGKIQDDPDRYQRSLNTVKSNLEKSEANQSHIQAQIDEKEKKQSENSGKIESLKKRIMEKEEDNAKASSKDEELQRMKTAIQNTVNKEKHLMNMLAASQKDREQEALEMEFRIKEQTEADKKLKKAIDREKKEYKKQENKRNTIKNSIFEFERSLSKMVKEKTDVTGQINKFKYMTGRIAEEEMLLFHKYETYMQEEKVEDESLKGLEGKIEDYESNLENLKNTESGAVKAVKNMTMIREAMARKASSALGEVRETREELKIKELLILDLTKKQQEIESQLNSFKAYYEEVKSARNKYVNLIQNSSQNLAELKEHIKISQNELEILKNESSEKQRTLNRLGLTIQKHKHDRDKARTNLNRLDSRKKTLIERGSQQANEIAKLNMITLSLQNDMLEIRKLYERACESRNYMGVQLIDRNDELCILYEKNNIQENILKNSETLIKRKEDEVRMIKIEIAEISRKIEVEKKKLPTVPGLAQKVVNLKMELENEKQRENEISEKLEDPQNPERWRQFKGEDPDQEALDAKIQVLEERLNLKKETLLEKELILDEVTNLSESLRKQALEGRYSTLEVSTKVNDLQARLKKITRKMMATISELSMFQANVIKLNQEKEEAQSRLETVQERVEEQMPPTEDAEILFLKKLRDKKRYQEQLEVSHLLLTARLACRKRLSRTTCLLSLSAPLPNPDPMPTQMIRGFPNPTACFSPSRRASWESI